MLLATWDMADRFPDDLWVQHGLPHDMHKMVKSVIKGARRVLGEANISTTVVGCPSSVVVEGATHTEQASFNSTEPEAVASELLEALKETFELDAFRPGQLEVMQSVMAGHDVFVSMPTGMGKSLLFQLPATITKGVTIVISPLLALMEQQGERMNELGVSKG